MLRHTRQPRAVLDVGRCCLAGLLRRRARSGRRCRRRRRCSRATLCLLALELRSLLGLFCGICCLGCEQGLTTDPYGGEHTQTQDSELGDVSLCSGRGREDAPASTRASWLPAASTRLPWAFQHALWQRGSVPLWELTPWAVPPAGSVSGLESGSAPVRTRAADAALLGAAPARRRARACRGAGLPLVQVVRPAAPAGSGVRARAPGATSTRRGRATTSCCRAVVGRGGGKERAS